MAASWHESVGTEVPPTRAPRRAPLPSEHPG
ncbi:DUF6053 domain-containing protein [Lysobacter enzymogenes]